MEGEDEAEGVDEDDNDDVHDNQRIASTSKHDTSPHPIHGKTTTIE